MPKLLSGRSAQAGQAVSQGFFILALLTLGHMVLCCGCRSLHCSMFGGIPGFYPVDAAGTPPPPKS